MYISMKSCCVPDYCMMIVITPMHKGRGNKNGCKNYRGESLLSTIYKEGLSRDIVKRISDLLVRVNQGRFRKGRGCTDPIFALM